MKKHCLRSINKIISSYSLAYKFHKASLATPEEKVETYHRIAEALKFGNMLRPRMSDPAFSEAQVSSMVCGYSATAPSSAPTCSCCAAWKERKYLELLLKSNAAELPKAEAGSGHLLCSFSCRLALTSLTKDVHMLMPMLR